jgi:hypothetical protein
MFLDLNFGFFDVVRRRRDGVTMVDAGLLFGSVVVLVVSLIMTSAFFILNSKLEDENKSLKEQLKKFE